MQGSSSKKTTNTASEGVRVARNEFVTVCAECGSEIEHGKRVRVSLSWEEVKTLERSDGRTMSYVDSHSRSTMVCRACAYRLSETLGLERP